MDSGVVTTSVLSTGNPFVARIISNSVFHRLVPFFNDQQVHIAVPVCGTARPGSKQHNAKGGESLHYAIRHIIYGMMYVSFTHHTLEPVAGV